jgi:Zn-dependent peptidase ImmA (M78 family)
MRRVHQAWRTAERILEKHNVQRAPVDVRAIASAYATVVDRILDPEISGVVAPIDQGKWIIVVNSGHPSVRRRFTIAHELGHILLHGYTAPHADRTFRFRDARSSEGSALEEIQANQFAAELLMPRPLLLKATSSYELYHAPSSAGDDEAFEACVANLAKHFKVSRQAMTIRLSSLFA